MRDPMTWSLPLGQLFGVVVRVHFLFPIMAIGLVLRTAFIKDALPGLWVETVILVGLLFFAVLLHEFGHVFAARALDGDASEVMLWPLGGLVFPEVPHTPRVNCLTALGGPVVNILLALGAVAGLAAFSATPSFEPWADPYFPVVNSWAEHASLGSKTGRGDLWKFTAYKNNGTFVTPDKFENGNAYHNGNLLDAVVVHPGEVVYQPVTGKPIEEQFHVWQDKEQKITARVSATKIASGVWVVLLARLFWVNWFLALVNLMPAFPLDGGRILQSFLWWRSDYRQATLVAIFVGFLMMFVVLIYALVAAEQILPLGLAVFIYVACRRQWILLETGGEESLFGYDFSQGYTSLERTDQPAGAPLKKRQSWWQRWMQRRAAKRMQKEQEQREAEERRMDELLEKVQRQGLAALTEEERRFLTRVSAKYRNRQ